MMPSRRIVRHRCNRVAEAAWAALAHEARAATAAAASTMAGWAAAAAGVKAPEEEATAAKGRLEARVAGRQSRTRASCIARCHRAWRGLRLRAAPRAQRSLRAVACAPNRLWARPPLRQETSRSPEIEARHPSSSRSCKTLAAPLPKAPTPRASARAGAAREPAIAHRRKQRPTVFDRCHPQRHSRPCRPSPPWTRPRDQ